MATYDDPEFDPDELETIEGAGGRPRRRTDDALPAEGLAGYGAGFLKAKLDVSWADGCRLDVRCWSYESTEEIEANKLAGFVSGPDLPEIDEGKVPKDATGAPDYEQVNDQADGAALPMESDAVEDLEAFRLWRRIGILRPDHVRAIEAHL